MRKRSKALALLLTVAMTFTSFTMPAFAEEAVTEEIATEAVDEETEIQVDSQEDEATGMYGTGEVFYATSYNDFAKLLNEASAGNAITVHVQKPYTEEENEDFYASRSGDYTVSSNIVISGNVDIVYDEDVDFVLPVDKEGKEIPATFTVNQGATVTITDKNEKDDISAFPMNIVNDGDLTIKSRLSINTTNGVAVKNNAAISLDGSKAGALIIGTYEEGQSAVINSANATMDLWDVTIFGTSKKTPKDNEKVPELYTLVNNGKLVSELDRQGSFNVDGDILNAVGATADFRGNSSAYVVVNKGALVIGGEGARSGHSSRIGILYSIDGGAATIHEGTEIAHVELWTPEATDGTLTMTGGYIYDQIWYKANAPKLLGGIVSKSNYNGGYYSDKSAWESKSNIVEELKDAAVIKIIGYDEKEAEPYKIESAYIVDSTNAAIPIFNGVKENSSVIYNGMPFNKKASAPAAGIIYKDIRTLSELKAAAAAGGYYRLLRTLRIGEAITVSASEPLYIETSVEYTNENDYTGGLVFTVSGNSIGSLNVNEGSSLEIEDADNNTDYEIYIDGQVSGKKEDGKVTVNTIINNKGTLTVGEGISVDVNSRYITLIDNAGTLNIEDDSVVDAYYVDNSTIIKNKGTMTLDGRLYAGNVENTTVVNNTGVFNMLGGTINCAYSEKAVGLYNAGTAEILNGMIYAYDSDADSAAIMYKPGNEVLLTGGRIVGARGTDKDVLVKYLYKEDGTPDFDEKGQQKISENPVYGSAIVADGFTTGYYMVAASAEPVSSKNAGYIENGDVPYEISVVARDDYDYMLMEKGEMAFKDDIFYVDVENNTFGKEPYDLVTLTSNRTDVAAPAQKTLYEVDSEMYEAFKGDTEKYDVLVANGFGQAIITATEEISGACDTVTVEVVTSRKNLVADNYAVDIGSTLYDLNAYRTSLDMELEWYLKSDTTGKEYDPNTAFKPAYVTLTGATNEAQEAIDRYFDAVRKPLRFNDELKTYNFRVDTKRDIYGMTTCLAQDEVKEIKDVVVNVFVKNKISDKMIEITLPYTFDIAIDQKRPVVKFNKLQLNGAYTDAHIDSDEINDVMATGYTVSRIVEFDADHDFEFEYGTYKYAGPAKSKSYKIPVSVELEGYVGKYQGTLPVAVKSVFPKLYLDQKKIIVPKGQANYKDIVLDILAKDKMANGDTSEMIAHLSSVTTDSTEFTVVHGNYYGASTYVDLKKKIYTVPGYGDFELRPNGDITKATKVNLEVSFDRLKYKKGAPYKQKLSVTITPVDEAKFKMSPSRGYKPTIYVYKDEAGVLRNGTPNPANVSVALNPGNYTNGYFTVSSLDGKLEVDDFDIAGGIQNTGRLVIGVNAGPALTEKDKKAELLIKWFSAEGTQLGKDLKVKVAVNNKPSSVAEVKKPVVINLGKEYKYDMSLDSYVRSMGGLLKTKVVNAEPDYGVTADGRFSVSWTGKNGTYLVYPTTDALVNGKIAANKEYDEVIKFTGYDKKTYDIAIKVKVLPATPKIGVIHDGDITMSGITNAARNTFAVATYVPLLGLKVASAKLVGADSANYVLTESRYENVYAGYGYMDNLQEDDADYVPDQRYDWSTYNWYTLSYANNTIPAGLKEGKQNIEIELTYTDGSTAKVKLPVVVVGSMTKTSK